MNSKYFGTTMIETISLQDSLKQKLSDLLKKKKEIEKEMIDNHYRERNTKYHYEICMNEIKSIRHSLNDNCNLRVVK